MMFLLPLLRRFWFVIPLVLMSLVTIYYRHAYTSTAQELDTFKQQQHDLVVKAEAENKVKMDIAREVSATAAKVHAAEQSAILNNFVNVINKGKQDHENTKVRLNTANANLELLRRRIEIDTSPVPDGGAGGPVSPGIGGDSITALLGKIETCETANAITASDYNELKIRFDANCLATGCVAP